VTPTATILDSEELWIVDTGATSHVTKFTTGGINQRKSTIKMKGWMNNSAAGTYEMDIPVRYCDRDGNKLRAACLTDVQVNERFNFNLFSITKMLLKGYQLKGDKKQYRSGRERYRLFLTLWSIQSMELYFAQS